MSKVDLVAGKTYADGDVLTEEDLDNILTELKKYFNQTAVTLADNQVTPAAVLGLAASSNNYIELQYSMKRGTAIEVGHLHLTNNGTLASVSTHSASVGTLGVSFSADINAGNARLLYTSTNTGDPIYMTYSVYSKQV